MTATTTKTTTTKDDDEDTSSRVEKEKASQSVESNMDDDDDDDKCKYMLHTVGYSKVKGKSTDEGADEKRSRRSVTSQTSRVRF